MIDNVEELIERELPGIPGWCTTEKGKRMARLCQGASLCVELGVFGGRGLVAMALALKDQGHGEAHGIDPFTSDAALEGTNDPANDEWWSKLDLEAIGRSAQETIDQLGLTGITRIIRSRSQEVVVGYGDFSVDVLHQDSNHSEEVSCAEVALWASKLTRGGIWIFDDTDWPSTHLAQKQLVAVGFTELEDHGSWKVYRRNA